ncbi:MAG TPA: prepilin-type N-terminal cleavage/methylation domain-containing protein [Burkholderiaceae bacterium]
MTLERNARGLSLVELLVGLALSLLIAAAATALLVDNLRENRKLLTDARVTQELRGAMDLMVREARRAGHWGAAATRSGTMSNPYAAIAPNAAASDAMALRYSQDDSSVVDNNTVDSAEQFGFRLRGGAIEAQLGERNWQAVTDATAMVITRLRIEPHVESTELESACSLACAGMPSCVGPRVQVRSLVIEVGARAANDAAITRSARTTVRLRNDDVSAGCAV